MQNNEDGMEKAPPPLATVAIDGALAIVAGADTSSCVLAHTMYCDVGNDLGRANVLLGLGQLHYARSNYVEARKSFSEARGVYASINNELGQAHAFDGLGKVCVEQDKYGE